MRWIISPTSDWTPSPAFPSIDGAFHWSVMDGPKWLRIDHGFADSIEEAKEAIERCIQASSSS